MQGHVFWWITHCASVACDTSLFAHDAAVLSFCVLQRAAEPPAWAPPDEAGRGVRQTRPRREFCHELAFVSQFCVAGRFTNNRTMALRIIMAATPCVFPTWTMNGCASSSLRPILFIGLAHTGRRNANFSRQRRVQNAVADAAVEVRVPRGVPHSNIPPVSFASVPVFAKYFSVHLRLVTMHASMLHNLQSSGGAAGCNAVRSEGANLGIHLVRFVIVSIARHFS